MTERKRDFTDEIIEWEEKNKLFEKGSVRGFDFYSYLRRELVNTAVNSKNGIKTDPFESKGQKDTGLKLFFKLLKKSEKPPIKNVDLLILCHPRRQKAGDVYESVFTDFLEDHFENSLTLERLFDDHSHYEPAKTKHLCYTDRLTLRSYVKRLLAKKLRPSEYEAIKAEVRAIMEEPMLSFEKEHGVDLKRKTYYERAVILYYFYLSRKKDYEKFLDEVKPKLVAEVVSKSVDAMLINELCHERGIKVVELQHSLLGPIARYPKGITEKQSPDYYLSYSDYWSEYQSYPIKDENVFSCGSPYFERQVMKYKKPSAEHSDVKKVLFISGAAYGEALSKVACDLKKLGETQGTKIEVIYKLHPDEFGSWREKYPLLVENNVNVIDSRDVSIYEFFNDADAQVGVFSTALYEGIAFDLDTYILNISFAAEFIDFCHDGYGTLINSGQELYDALTNEKPAGAKLSGSALSEKFWKQNAEQNIVERLKMILASN